MSKETDETRTGSAPFEDLRKGSVFYRTGGAGNEPPVWFFDSAELGVKK